MKILIDGRPFVAPSAGISNFLKGSLIAWAKHSPDDTFCVAIPRHLNNTLSSDILPTNVKIIERSTPILRLLPNIVWLLVMMPILARKWHATTYYSPLPCLPYFLPKRMLTIIVVHDVVNIEYQTTMKWTNILANKLLFGRSIKKANVIWTNSKYTKGKVEHYFPHRRCSNIFTGCAVNRAVYRPLSISQEEAQTICKTYGIHLPFILFVGSLEPRKNLSFLLSLMPQLYKHSHVQLVVVGASGWKNSHIKNLIMQPDFPRESTIFCGYVPEDDLAKLYNMALCFVSAAINEGFGMPQLEALLCQCPVVTAHNSAMVEVTEGVPGAFTIHGYEADHWIESIKGVISERPYVDTRMLAHYDWDSVLNHFCHYCQEMVSI